LRGYQEAIDIVKTFGDLEFRQGDITDSKFLDSVFAEFKIDAVIHLAALCNPSESFSRAEEYFKVNLWGTLTLLEAMHRAKVVNLTFASTCSVYDDTLNRGIKGDDPILPHTPYAESKILAEEAIKLYNRRYGFNYIIFHFFNICGADPDGLIGDSKKPSQLLMQNAVRGALGIEPFYFTCSEVATPDGTPIRDYVDVVDVARAEESAVDYLLNGGKSEVINLGSGEGHSVKEVVTRVEEVLGAKLDRKQSTPRLGDPIALYADISAAKSVLDWMPTKSLDDSIRSLAKWYKGHPNGYSR
jgi:UDP-glucose 4-epimerase